MGAGVHKCSSTKARHMPQAGGSSTNNCQFLGSFKCLLRLHLSFFIGKTQVLEQKHPNLSPLCLHLESEDIFWLNWLWSCPSQRGGGCVLPGQIVESSPAGTQVVGFLPNGKSHRFFLRCVFSMFFPLLRNVYRDLASIMREPAATALGAL